MLHINHALQHGLNRILVKTVDTDVVVLAVVIATILPVDSKFGLHLAPEKCFDTWQRMKLELPYDQRNHLRYLCFTL